MKERNMKFRLLALALSLVCSQTILAAKFDPEVCPSVKAIKAAGVTHAEKHNGNWTAIGEANRYGTEEEWRFYIEVKDNVKSEQEAVAVGNAKVKDLAITILGPISDDDKKFWGCLYFTNDKSAEAFAITPPDANPSVIKSRLRG